VIRLFGRTLALATAVCALAASSGCLALTKAAHVEVQVLDGSIVLIKPTGGIQHGGETVLKIDNFAQRPVNMVLVETSLPAKRLPKKLVDAVSARDDKRIVGITSQISKVGVAFVYGAIPQASPKVATLHVYLKAGKRYLLFDKLGGYEHGVALAFVVPAKK
jgi:hypothetical protein